MCRSHRRCKRDHDSHNARRRRNRAAKRKAVQFFKDNGMDKTAQEMKSAQPSDIPIIMESLAMDNVFDDGEIPGIINGKEYDVSHIINTAKEENPGLVKVDETAVEETSSFGDFSLSDDSSFDAFSFSEDTGESGFQWSSTGGKNTSAEGIWTDNDSLYYPDKDERRDPSLDPIDPPNAYSPKREEFPLESIVAGADSVELVDEKIAAVVSEIKLLSHSAQLEERNYGRGSPEHREAEEKVRLIAYEHRDRLFTEDEKTSFLASFSNKEAHDAIARNLGESVYEARHFLNNPEKYDDVVDKDLIFGIWHEDVESVDSSNGFVRKIDLIEDGERVGIFVANGKYNSLTVDYHGDTRIFNFPNDTDFSGVNGDDMPEEVMLSSAKKAIEKLSNTTYKIPQEMLETGSEDAIQRSVMSMLEENADKIGTQLSVSDLDSGKVGDGMEQDNKIVEFSDAQFEKSANKVHRPSPSSVGLDDESATLYRGYGYSRLSQGEKPDSTLTKSIFEKSYKGGTNDIDGESPVENMEKVAEENGLLSSDSFLNDFEEYSGGAYTAINEYNCGRMSLDNSSDSVKSTVGMNSLSAMAKEKHNRGEYYLPKEGALLIRGFRISHEHGDTGKVFSSMFEEGSVIVTEGFTSTSIEDFSEAFGGGGYGADGYRMEIVSREGVPVWGKARMEGEKEVILPRESKLRVMEVDQDNRVVRVVDEAIYQESLG